MKLGVMQPYFLPYIGYFQLMAAVDEFIVYDNIKYTKKGWINRNRLLLNGQDAMFSLPLKKGSDTLDIVERELAETFDAKALVNQFKGAYSKAPFFSQTLPLLEHIAHYPKRGLFDYLLHSICAIGSCLGIETPVTVSSTVPIDHELKAQDKVLAFCASRQATTYINAVGGQALYDVPSFAAQGVDLKFLKTRAMSYDQQYAGFIPHLSIIDVLMFNDVHTVREWVFQQYDLV